jgi:predicted DNA-binding transcriptional regulator YafY
VADGWLTAYDDDADQPRTFALHRIAAARIISDDDFDNDLDTDTDTDTENE